MTIGSVLIANRGEIAVRIARTLKAMGIRSIAVFSEADADAMHVRVADAAYAIGPAPARESYLDGARIIAAAHAAGADAVHPGYGFLSENADFAEAVTAAGLIFIGPPASAIRAMGSKSAGKRLMAKAGVPLVPGYHDDDQSPETLRHEAARLGYPVLIKASAGGGGRGMKVVETADAFAAALASAQREARSGFGDDRVLLEKYLTSPRHIEVQIFADSHGNVVHLFERDCSIQRRHQKLVEEAPAPGMTIARRDAMGAAAVQVARAVGYVGAGTVEFIIEDDAFFFMEMNTRLQVEHPVTEAITGLDLVEWQIKVARGEPLPLTQADLRIRGHAIEVRLYAEDPARDFLPQSGRIEHLALPRDMAGVRIDAGVETGDTVTSHYDPMLAKIIAAGDDRDQAIARLRQALAATQITGIATNRALLRAIVAQPAFASGDLDTGFLVRHAADLLAPPGSVPAHVVAIAAFAWLRAEHLAQAASADPADPFSPWGSVRAWWLNGVAYADLVFLDGERPLSVRVHGSASTAASGLRDSTMKVEVPGHAMSVSGSEDLCGDLNVRVDAVRLKATVIREDARLTVFLEGQDYRLVHLDPRSSPRATSPSAGRLVAPMPGRVIQVDAAPGRRVKKGDALIVIEAMKMEHVVGAPRDGTIASVHFAIGDTVAEGAELLTLEDPG